MKKIVLALIILFTGSLYASEKCKVNIEFNTISGNQRKGIERLIRKELKKKGYKTKKEGFMYPDFELALTEGMVCQAYEEGISIFEEVMPHAIFGELTNLHTGHNLSLHGWGEGRIFREILGRNLRNAIKDSFNELPKCGGL